MTPCVVSLMIFDQIIVVSKKTHDENKDSLYKLCYFMRVLLRSRDPINLLKNAQGNQRKDPLCKNSAAPCVNLPAGKS